LHAFDVPTRPRIDLAALISAAEAADLSRAEIARRAGLSPSMVTMIANGERGTRPSAATFLALKAVADSVVPATFTTVNK